MVLNTIYQKLKNKMSKIDTIKIRKIVDHINSLNKKEKNILFKYFSDFNSNETQVNSPDNKLFEFYSIIDEILKNKYNIISPPYQLFIKMKGNNSIKNCYESLINFYYLYHNTKKIDKRNFYLFIRFYVNISKHYCNYINIPVSMKTIILQHTNLYGMIDRFFPNYIENKLLHKIKDF